MATAWTPELTKKSLAGSGTIKSFSYLGIDEEDPAKVVVYKVVYSKYGPATFSLKLHEDGSVGTLRTVTESDGITKLLEKEKAGKKK